MVVLILMMLFMSMSVVFQMDNECVSVIFVNGVKGVSESSVKMVCVYRVLVVSMNSIKGMSKSCVEMISVQ